MKLKISAPATVLDTKAGDEPVTDPARLATLEGVSSDECFSDYLLDDSATKALPSRGVSGGYLRVRYRADLRALWVETEYDLREPLTDAEIQALTVYTLGQWSDGIGENFFPEYAEKAGLFIVPHDDEVVTEMT